MSSIAENNVYVPGTPAPVKSASPAAWPAIIAGAFVATGATLILFSLGSGLGFAEVSPWSDRGVTATTFTVTMAIWLLVTQWISAGLGGYIAGRLRTTWTGTHSHEVFFRDTANGLVTWAVSTLVVTAVVASSVISVISGGLHGASSVASGAAQGAVASAHASPVEGTGYGIDRLFRLPAAGGTTSVTAAASGAESRSEATRILGNAVVTGELPEQDRNYLSQLIAQNTGVASDEAQKRVNELWSDAQSAAAKAKAAADAAREAASQAAIYTALSLLVGAFIASVAAALGGRLRDEHP